MFNIQKDASRYQRFKSFFGPEEETKEAGAFDPGKPYQPSLMFESKAGA